MASRAANFRSTCDSDRALPECSTQAFPAGTPQVGQRTEDICFAVSSLFFILSECDYTHSRESVDLLTSPVLALSYAQKQYGGRRNVRLTYGKIGGHIDRTDTASRTSWREPFVQRFLFVLIDEFVYCGTAGNAALQFSCLLIGALSSNEAAQSVCPVLHR
jgi:hypothetical protein